MIATLIIVFVLLAAAAAFVVYRRQQYKLLAGRARRELPPRPPRSLFADTQQALDESARALPEQLAHGYMEQRAAFMTRAASGDLSVLEDAQRTGDAALYRVVLNDMVERALKADERISALVAYIQGHEMLRGSVELAEAYSAVWQETPDRATTATMLHLAALADDADTYRKAAEIACLIKQSGQLPQLTNDELQQLIDSQYWLVAADARRTGAGFVLKQRLISLRDELAAAPAAPTAQGKGDAATSESI